MLVDGKGNHSKLGFKFDKKTGKKIDFLKQQENCKMKTYIPRLKEKYNNDIIPKLKNNPNIPM